MAESPSKWKENTVGKGEIAHYEQFLLFPLQILKTQGLFGKGLKALWEKKKGAIFPFPTVFSTCLENFLPFSSKSANSFSLEESKTCRLGKD